MGAKPVPRDLEFESSPSDVLARLGSRRAILGVVSFAAPPCDPRRRRRRVSSSRPRRSTRRLVRPPGCRSVNRSTRPWTTRGLHVTSPCRACRARSPASLGDRPALGGQDALRAVPFAVLEADLVALLGWRAGGGMGTIQAM